MKLAINIITIIGPLILAIYLWMNKKITYRNKIIAFIFCLTIIFSGLLRTIDDYKSKVQEDRQQEYYRDMQDKLYILSLGYPSEYIESLGKNPYVGHIFNEAMYCYSEYQYKDAITKLQECLSHPRTTAIDKAIAYSHLGNCYSRLDEYKKSIKFYKIALNESSKINDKTKRLSVESMVIYSIGLVCLKMHMIDEALKCAEEALEISKEIQYEHGIASGLILIGEVYRISGKYTDAQQYFKESLEICEITKNEMLYIACLIYLGDVYSDQGKYTEALQYYEESLELCEKLSWEEAIVDILVGFGSVYIHLHKYQIALTYYEKAYIIYERMEDKVTMARTLIYMGIINNNLCRFKEASKCFVKSIRIKHTDSTIDLLLLSPDK